MPVFSCCLVMAILRLFKSAQLAYTVSGRHVAVSPTNSIATKRTAIATLANRQSTDLSVNTRILEMNSRLRIRTQPAVSTSRVLWEWFLDKNNPNILTMPTLYIFTLPPPKKKQCVQNGYSVLYQVTLFKSSLLFKFSLDPLFTLGLFQYGLLHPGHTTGSRLLYRGSPFITTPLTFITYYLDFCSTSIIFSAKCQYLLRNKSLRHTRKYSRTNQKAICTINKQTATQSSATCSRPWTVAISQCCQLSFS